MRFLIGKADGAARVFDKALYHRQSQAGAAFSAGVEGTDTMVQHIRRKSCAVIQHGYA